MSNRHKWYVVWVGTEPGICESWEECQMRTNGFPGAKFKAFDSREDAVMAFRRGQDDDMSIIRALAKAPAEVVNYSAIPEILPGSIAVDAACSGNPGKMEYQGVEVHTGLQLFHKKFEPLATNNIGEFLAIVHALALLDKMGNTTKTIYSDSYNAMLWVSKRQCKTKLERTPQTEQLYQIVARAERWLQTHRYQNPIIKWDTKSWGEVPADFGRKK